MPRNRVNGLKIRSCQDGRAEIKAPLPFLATASHCLGSAGDSIASSLVDHSEKSRRCITLKKEQA